jgi:glycosyltransferase involved in cell wall biosynthesis
MSENLPETSRSLRILIIAHSFPPMNATAAHRPYSWARVWRDLGHEVHVLTPIKHPIDGAADLERDMSGIHVHEVPYLLGRSAASGDAARVSRRRVERWEWLKTWTRRARLSLAMFSDPRLLAYFPMVRSGEAVLRRARFDLIVATSPPEVVFLVARTLSQRLHVPWIADFRDLWFRDMRLYQSRLASWLSGPVNSWLVKHASALVTVSRGLQQRLAGYLGRDVFISYNGFFERDHGAAVTPEPWRDGKVHIVYTGRVYPLRRDPGPLLRALEELKSSGTRLADRLAIDFYGFDEPWLLSLVRARGVEDCVKLHGFVPYRDSVAAQRAADVLLFLDWTETQAEGVLTGKLFEYLASGRPVLGIGTRADTEAAQLIADARCGITLTRHEEIVAYLQQLLRSPRPPDTDASYAGAFSRERQASTLLAEIIARLPRREPGQHASG